MKLEFIWNLVLGKLGHYESNRAFTLIEVLVTLGIFIFIASFALGVGLDTYARTSINQERDNLVFLLSKARARSLNNINQSAHGIEIDDNEIVLYEAGGTAEERTTFNNNFSISGGPVEFGQLTGSTGGAEFELIGTGGPLTIDINSEGGIKW